MGVVMRVKDPNYIPHPFPPANPIEEAPGMDIMVFVEKCVTLTHRVVLFPEGGSDPTGGAVQACVNVLSLHKLVKHCIGRCKVSYVGFCLHRGRNLSRYILQNYRWNQVGS